MNSPSSEKTEALPDIAITDDIVVDGKQLLFILGPCVIESADFLRRMAQQIATIRDQLGIQVVFKASYDKANRTSVDAFRGPGCEAGCALLAEVAAEFEMPCCSDVHSPEEARAAGPFLDILQIPAFLCRQTDLLLAAAATGKVVNVKKGQFLAPWDVTNIAGKVLSSGNPRLLITERGTTFGYNNLVADMRSLAWIREAGCRVVFDATHSVQRPGGMGASTGGDGYLAPLLARSAVAAGCDGLFIETHEDPSKALSDGPNQIALSRLADHLQVLLEIHATVSR
jgi:2-dehydro-3-deoxyphosphooctonate aldolase (KDO 8-P synthase)